LFASGLERVGAVTLQALLLLELLLLLGFLVCCVNCGQRFDPNSGIAITAGMFGISAMAVQTALVQISLAKAPSTAVMTTNVAYLMLALGELLASRDDAVIASARKKGNSHLPYDCWFRHRVCIGRGRAIGIWRMVPRYPRRPCNACSSDERDGQAVSSFTERIASVDGYYETKNCVNARKQFVAKAWRKWTRPLAEPLVPALRPPSVERRQGEDPNEHTQANFRVDLCGIEGCPGDAKITEKVHSHGR
jgi:hypothetical protein